MTKVDISNIKTVFNGHLKVIKGEFTQTRDSGTSVITERLSVERGDSVGVLLYERSTNSYVFVNQYRFPVRGDVIEIIAGMIDKDEHPLHAAIRELVEEVGNYGTLYSTNYLGKFHLSPGMTSESIYLYYFEVDYVAGGGGLESEGEIIEIIRLPINHLDLYFKDEVMDAKTSLAIMLSSKFNTVNHQVPL